MEEILDQLRLVVYPIIYDVLYIPGGAGCLPSTVGSDLLRPCLVKHSGSRGRIPHGQFPTWNIPWRSVVNGRNRQMRRDINQQSGPWHNFKTCFFGKQSPYERTCYLGVSLESQTASPNYQSVTKLKQDMWKKNITPHASCYFALTTIYLILLVVSTHLKNISQIGSFPQVGMKIKNISNHHLVIYIYIYIFAKTLFAQITEYPRVKNNAETATTKGCPTWRQHLRLKLFRFRYHGLATKGVLFGVPATTRVSNIKCWLEQGGAPTILVNKITTLRIRIITYNSTYNW